MDAGQISDQSNAPENLAAVGRVVQAKPDLILVALGTPKQEIWIHHNAKAFFPALAIGVGASLDFISGRIKRAPPWVSKLGFEWVLSFHQRTPASVWPLLHLRHGLHSYPFCEPSWAEAVKRMTELPSVAVFDANTPPALAFTRSLGRAGVPVHVYSHHRYPMARLSRYAARFHFCPDLDDAELFLPWLKLRLQNKEISLIAPTSDLLAFYLYQTR